MGIFRFLLAASVIIGHSSPIFGIELLDAGLAVKVFFIISGFYMTLILNSKYHVQRGGYWLFISNRCLRIYPSYLLVLGVSLLFYAAASFHLHTPADRLQYWIDAWRMHKFWQLGLIGLSQLSIFGLDVTPLLDFQRGLGFGWTGSLGPGAIRAWRFNFLPHAWSISVELCFYLAAPFICLARRWILIALVIFGFAGCIAAGYLLPADVAQIATYHFFLFQISYLVLGVLSYYLFHPLFEKGTSHPALSWCILGPLGLVIFFSNRLPERVVPAVCISLAFVAVPLLFNLSRAARLDRFIGDLSYPMYLVHIICKWAILALMGVAKKDTAIVPGGELLILTVLAAIGLVWLVDYPVDRWRQARVARALNVPAGPQTQ